MPLADYQQTVPRLVRCQQTELVSAADVDRAIAAALVQYSGDAPRQQVLDVTWGVAGYMADAPPEIRADSRILQAEYPVGQTPVVLIGVALQVLPGDDLALIADTHVSAGATVRLTFTGPHTVVGGGQAQDTVPEAHRPALSWLAASFICRELAAHFSGERESSIGADASNTESRARNYAQRAKEYRAAYFAALGLSDPMLATSGGAAGGGAASAAGTMVSWPGRQRGPGRVPGVLL